MTETLTNWSLDTVNQVCVTTDNGSNIICATSSRLGWNHLSCFGLNLHLAVTNSMKDELRITRAFGVCRKLVELFAHSWKKKRELSEAQVQLKLPNHSLVSDCLTRWGSKEKMVARVLEQEKAIRQVVGTDCKTCHLLPVVLTGFFILAAISLINNTASMYNYKLQANNNRTKAHVIYL